MTANMSDMKKAMMETQDGGKVRNWGQSENCLCLCHFFVFVFVFAVFIDIGEKLRKLIWKCCVEIPDKNHCVQLDIRQPLYLIKSNFCFLQFLFTSESVGEGHPGKLNFVWPVLIQTLYQGIWNGWIEAFVASDIRAISCNPRFWLMAD